MTALTGRQAIAIDDNTPYETTAALIESGALAAVSDRARDAATTRYMAQRLIAKSGSTAAHQIAPTYGRPLATGPDHRAAREAATRELDKLSATADACCECVRCSIDRDEFVTARYLQNARSQITAQWPGKKHCPGTVISDQREGFAMRSERRPDFPRGVVLPATPEMDAATLQNSFVRSRAVLSRWRVVENFPVATRRGNVWWTSVSEVAQFCDRKQIKVIWV